MAKAHKLTGVEPLRSYRENARTILPQKVEEVWTWEPFIRDASRREELHNMRISIKRLRYTMEIFHVAYTVPKEGFEETAVICGKRFSEFLAVIVDLQEILGDVHDADVVLDVLTDDTQRTAENVLAPGVATLIARTRKTRKADYETFLKKWEHLSATGIKQKLLSFLGE
ncbi:MAG: CHAD domain-containing protein [Candidatus Poribacteria bacterium]|nr:CHAD domain-containing protein [Candidatus Poribacteria bacterium]